VKTSWTTSKVCMRARNSSWRNVFSMRSRRQTNSTTTWSRSTNKGLYPNILDSETNRTKMKRSSSYSRKKITSYRSKCIICSRITKMSSRSKTTTWTSRTRLFRSAKTSLKSNHLKFIGYLSSLTKRWPRFSSSPRKIKTRFRKSWSRGVRRFREWRKRACI